MGQFHWDPAGYLALMREEVPDYDRLQDEIAAAAGAVAVRRILDLGTGTGTTAASVAACHPHAGLVGVDASEAMLQRARERLPGADLRAGRLEDPLPDGPFDLVVSALAVHHLDGAGKAALFRRVAGVLRPGGRFVLGDVVVPEDPADVLTPVDDDMDKPSLVADQLRWLADAGLRPAVAWGHRDLAVLVGQAPGHG